MSAAARQFVEKKIISGFCKDFLSADGSVDMAPGGKILHSVSRSARSRPRVLTDLLFFGSRRFTHRSGSVL